MEAPVPVTIAKERRRFYDGGVWSSGDQPEIPPNPDEDPRIVLERRLVEGEELFVMQRRIAYLDRDFGELLVPDGLAFTTDLTSVPALFTWLVPKTGAHLPAALLHDGLCCPPEARTFVRTDGDPAELTRVDADRILRDAMADTGTPLVRRWLVWAAVATSTMVFGRDTSWSPGERFRYRWVALVSLGLVALLGVFSTLDLFDVRRAPPLPWMGEASFLVELVKGLLAAVVVPAVLGLLWGRFRIAGWIMLIGLAVLLHVTIALFAITLLYRATEWLAARLPRRRTTRQPTRTG
ncbi:DUF1353 domain-containing protein [Nocardioides cavernaquae]|uniref:DUF1353 domain-containing protein n=1 Tax=Nocardioides cavernaquae TaxID=2321396 RepID=A0A3A5H397_9ACTN|nr:DUF1353 domain-containing protein [Nocardioides cavernaquae]RJS45243.1 DUF1353 domain-containing protein [Nocardioides cavernaquae]